jgi:hypothetical protein
MPDSPRWCEQCGAYGDHHTDRHPTQAARMSVIKLPMPIVILAHVGIALIVIGTIGGIIAPHAGPATTIACGVAAVIIGTITSYMITKR